MAKYLVVFGWTISDHFREQTMLFDTIESVVEDITSCPEAYESWEMYEVTRTTGYQEVKTINYEEILNLLEKEDD